MLEYRFVIQNADLIKKNLEKRQNPEYLKLLEELLGLEFQRKKRQVEMELARSERNKITKSIADSKKQGTTDVTQLIEKSKALDDSIKTKEAAAEEIFTKIKEILKRIPNLLDESVPYGKDDTQNTVIKEWGSKKTTGKSHVDWLLERNYADFDNASRVSGARFYYLKNKLAKLDLALQFYALELLEKKGFEIILPPLMLHKKEYEGVTDLGTFEDVLYKIEDEDAYLIATSEHPIIALHSESEISIEQLPLKYAGFSPCFRKEAGAHGKDTKGIFRVHNFNKVEQVVYCKPEDSNKLFEEILQNTEEIIQGLEIPYRLVNVCTGDIGVVAAKKIDLEAWMSHQQKYRELASCSNCTSYQSVRSNIKQVDKHGTKTYLHTLNNTGLATTRTIVALIENNVNEENKLVLPKPLRKYFGDQETI